MEVFTLAMLGALVVKATGLLKLLRAKLYGDALTQLVAAGAGVAVTFLARASDVMADFDVEGVKLGTFDDATAVLFGLGLASAASYSYDWKKAVDGSDSAAEPPLAPALNNPSHDVSGNGLIALIVGVVLLVIALKLLLGAL